MLIDCWMEISSVLGYSEQRGKATVLLVRWLCCLMVNRLVERIHRVVLVSLVHLSIARIECSISICVLRVFRLMLQVDCSMLMHLVA